MDSESKTTTILEMALQYAAMGWHVFPCQPRSKIPYPGTRGVKDATTDQDVIRAWFTRWTDANIALACGVGDVPIYVVDVDVDNEKGINGFESLEEFQDVLPRPQT
ncbi:MAG: bifunctional DNA primase/polymerase, partial [Patescibacteria group bacterium]